jgi:hypothetical protein
MKTFSYILTIIGTLIGGTILLFTLLADSAPQQGAGAAMAVAWAVIPYCFARAVEKIGQVSISDALERQWRREQGDAVAVTQKTQAPPKFHDLTLGSPPDLSVGGISVGLLRPNPLLALRNFSL